MTRDDLRLGDQVWSFRDDYRPVLLTVTSLLVPAGADADGREVSLHTGYVARTERDCWRLIRDATEKAKARFRERLQAAEDASRAAARVLGEAGAPAAEFAGLDEF